MNQLKEIVAIIIGITVFVLLAAWVMFLPSIGFLWMLGVL